MLTGLIKVRISDRRRLHQALILTVMPALAAAASRMIDAVDGAAAPDAAMAD